MIKLSLILLILFACSYAELPFSGGKDSFDFGLGVTGSTPLTLFASSTSEPILVEVSCMSLYEYSFRGASQLYVATGGGRLRRGSHAFGVTFQLLDAFNLYREVFPAVSYVKLLGKRWQGVVKLCPSIASIETDYAFKWASEFGVAYDFNAVRLRTNCDLLQLESESDKAKAVIQLGIEATENKFGSQAASFQIDVNAHVSCLSLAEVFRL